MAPKSPPVVLWFVIGWYPNSRLPWTNSRPTHNLAGEKHHYMKSSNTNGPLCAVSGCHMRTRLCKLELGCESMSVHKGSPLPINPANKQNKHSSCYTPHSSLHSSQHRLSLEQDHFHIVCTTWTRLVISILGLYCHGEDYGVRLDWHVNTGTGLVDTINMSCQQNIYTLSI